MTDHIDKFILLPFQALPLSDIQHKDYRLLSFFTDEIITNQDIDARAIFMHILFFINRTYALALGQGNLLLIESCPFWRSEIGPANLTGLQFRAAVPNKIQESIVGIADMPINIREEQTDDVGLRKQAQFFLVYLELFFSFFVLGQVNINTEHTQRPLLLIVKCTRFGIHPVDTLIGPDYAELDIQRNSLFYRFVERRMCRREVIGMDQPGPGIDCPPKLTRNQAKALLRLFAPDDPSARNIPLENTYARRFLQKLELFLTLP